VEPRPLAELKEQGIDTRASDLEGEINGLLTYDSRVRKIPAEALREVARTLVE